MKKPRGKSTQNEAAVPEGDPVVLAAPENTAPETPPTEAPESLDVPESAEAALVEMVSDAPVEPVAEPAPVQPAKPRSGFFPMMLGGVVAAGLGFVTAQVLKPEGWPFPGQGDLSAKVDEQARAIDALTAALAEAQAQPSEAAALDQALGLVQTLEARVATLESVPVAEAAAPVDLAPVMAEIAALKAQLAEQGPSAADITAQIEAANAAAAARLAEAEAQAEARRVEAERLATLAAARTAAAALLAAGERGDPFAEPLAALAGSGVTVPETLTAMAETGVPSLLSLQEGFAEPARAALAATVTVDASDGVGDRLAAFLRAQTNVRSLEPREGDDPDAILSRAEDALRRNALAEALSLVATLPPAGQEAMAGWSQAASQRLEALEAIQTLTQSLAE